MDARTLLATYEAFFRSLAREPLEKRQFEDTWVKLCAEVDRALAEARKSA